MIWYLLHSVVLGFLWWALRPPQGMRPWFVAGVVVRLGAGLLLGYIYFIHLGAGDTLAYHQMATDWYQLAASDPSAYLEQLFTRQFPVFKSEARTELFVKIVSLFYVGSGGSYWITSLYLSLVGFLGSWYLVLSICKYHPEWKHLAAMAFLMYPSCVFWSSGVMKDPLTNGSVFFLAGIALHWVHQHSFRWWEVVLTALALLLLFYLKHYLFALSFFCLSLLGIITLLRERIAHSGLRTLLFIVLMIGSALLVSRANFNLNLEHLPQTVYSNYHLQESQSEGENVLYFPDLKPTWPGLLANAPAGLLAGLFRPLPWEGSGWSQWYAMENLLLIILFGMVTFRIRKWRFSTLGCLAMIFVLILAVFLPLVAPNFGSLMRYKAAFLPFFVFGLLVVVFGKFRKASD